MNDRRRFDPYAALTSTMPGSDAQRPLVVEDDPRWPDAASTPDEIMGEIREWLGGQYLVGMISGIQLGYPLVHAAASAVAAV